MTIWTSPDVARLRNLHGWNQCLLSGVVQTRFTPGETFDPDPKETFGSKQAIGGPLLSAHASPHASTLLTVLLRNGNTLV